MSKTEHFSAVYGYICPSGSRKDAWRLLEYAWRDVYGTPMPPVEKHPTGKPYFPAAEKVYFSLSHTKTHVMAVIGSAPCGCDVETCRTVPQSLPQRVCTQVELEEFSFLQCWVLKESLLKISGVIPKDFRTLCFTRRDGTITGPNGEMGALYPAAGAFAAIVTEGCPPPESLITVKPENLPEE